MPIVLQNVLYGSLADRPWTFDKFCVSIGLNHLSVRYEYHLLIGRETMWEKASVQRSWQIPGDAHHHVQTTSLECLTVVVFKALKLVGRHLLAILLVNHDRKYRPMQTTNLLIRWMSCSLWAVNYFIALKTAVQFSLSKWTSQSCELNALHQSFLMLHL